MTLEVHTPELGKKIDGLTKQVERYAGKARAEPVHNPVFESHQSIIPSSIEKSFLSKYKLYIAIPLIIFFFLVMIRPTFIKREKKDKSGYVLDFKKLLLFWLVFTLIIFLGIFGYKYKMKNN